jgi:archaetidylinositol phosphate synthase
LHGWQPKATLYSMLDTWMAKSRWLSIAQARAAAIVHDAGIGANQATAAAAIVGVLSGLAFARGFNAAGLVALWASAMLDALDGTIARNFEGPTAFGGVLDLASDRLVEAAALLGLVWHRPELGFAALTVLASWYINITVFLGVGSALGGEEKLIHYPPGLVERTEVLMFFTVLVLVGAAAVWVCYAYAAMEILTAIQRLDFGRRQLR